MDMKTIRHEVRRDETDGTDYLWKITESEVPGEGGQERLTVVTRLTVSSTITQLEEKVAGARSTLEGLCKQRDFWYGVQAELIAADTPPAP